MNRIYSIHYDLLTPGQNYEPLIQAIKNLGAGWAKPLQSCFLIATSLSAKQIRDALTPLMDQNDRLLVILCGPDWASSNLPPEVTKWLNTNLA